MKRRSPTTGASFFVGHPPRRPRLHDHNHASGTLRSRQPLACLIEQPGFLWLRDERALAGRRFDISRYYFHFHDVEAHWDTEGVEFGSAAQASEEAVNLLGELMRERPSALLKEHGWRMEVEDEGGSTVYVISAFARPSMAMSQ